MPGTAHACAAGLCAALSIVALTACTAEADDSSVAAQAVVSSAASEQGDATTSLQRQIDELVRRLGSPHYAQRRAAANELRQIGPEAFDQLYSATDDADPEIAASARYLLQQIPVQWTRSNDSPLVRRIMRSYDGRSEEDRLLYVAALARLPGAEGTAALCRITRFERSPLVSRTAALAIIRPAEREKSTATVDPDDIERELGCSTRVSSAWLRQWLAQQRDPAASLTTWQQLIDEESERLAHNGPETNSQVVLGLLWNLLNLYHDLDQQQPTLETVNRMIALQTADPQQTVVDLIEWFADHKSWDALDQFLTEHQRQVEIDKRPLYMAALARAQQGQSQLADDLAARAAKLGSPEPFGSLRMAMELYTRGQFEWSVREYQNAIQNRPDHSPDVMPARVCLADMLHDHAQDGPAAEALAPLVTELEKNQDVSELYDRVRQFTSRTDDRELPLLPERASVIARYHYYRACDAAGRQDWAAAREELQAAINRDETDADVVIAMYRVPKTDDAWREQVRKRIESLSRLFQQQIDEAPSDTATAVACNQWAWLVANTEGDYQKAVQYSRRSLELMPDTASLLDTLGRCCYSAGDIESALKYQRQAIEKMPYMQVMHRQLATFERAQAENEARSKDRGASDEK
jgi:tetratricopeptide (TPR) repeat protein